MTNGVQQQTTGKIAVALLGFSKRLPRPTAKLGTLLLWLICGADIPARTSIGHSLRLPHGGRGVVVHPDAVIGDRVTLFHGATLAGAGDTQAAPILEDDAYVGAGAVILGGVRLGAGCRIGANAVVTCDVPAGATAVGVPARVLQTMK